MSLFLGKIHYILYNKIQVNEDILEEVLKFAEEKGLNLLAIKNQVYKKYGYPERRKLEDVIETSNIHGWLQSKIDSVEIRTAAIVTYLINNNISIGELSSVYFKNGKDIFNKNYAGIYSPKDLFMMIYDNLLEGMPCDMINEIEYETETEFSWNTTRSIHDKYWKEVKGSSENFYILRDAWINGFLKADGGKYTYLRDHNGNNKIVSI